MEYKDFLKTKEKKHIESGFEVENLNKYLFDFQIFIVKRALKKGRFAIFTDTGTGKTIMQLEWANQVNKHTNKPVLILAPLAVSGQTINEGKKFGIEVKRYGQKCNIVISNYEQLDNIDCSQFSGIVLDESSILKNFDGKTRKKIIELFKETPYKLACTATPSPNDPMELGNHAEFLNVMQYNEMLAMYFIHDSGNTSQWRLKKHGIDKFWQFVANWSIMMMKPQDLGFEKDGFDLPPLNLKEEQVKTDTKPGYLFNALSVNATGYNQELRSTTNERIDRVLSILKKGEKYIIWVKQNQEADLLKKRMNGYDFKEVRGNETPQNKESKLLGFANGEFDILITKAKIAQFGLNFQQCNNQIFMGVDFSFESTYQAIRRSYRYGQLKPVNVWLITTDTMVNVIEAQNKKQKQFNEMQTRMTSAVNKHLNNEIVKYNTEFAEKKNGNYHVMCGDSVKLIKKIDSNSIGLTVFSPPFAELYTYSDHIEDMGNSKNYNEFFEQFSYLTPDLYRIMKQGRIIAVHCMDLPIQKGKEGYIGLRDFSGMLIKNFQDNGFIYHSRITIWKDPVIEMQRTKALGLLHKQIKKDSTRCRVGVPDYILLFRKEGDNLEPVMNTNMPVETWQKWASPIWYDINQGNTLNFRIAKAEKDEKHICPMQLDSLERLILLYSNKGDTVFDPFGGIGTTGYESLTLDRKSISIELKRAYYEVNCRNHTNAIEEKGQLELI